MAEPYKIITYETISIMLSNSLRLSIRKRTRFAIRLYNSKN
mgnify:FL=1